ncbi:Structural maintenance of chromosomes protein 6, partial [Spiromyces aspiralis]
MVETLLDGKRHLEAAELEPDNASSRVQFKRARGNAEVGETKVRSVQARSKPGDSPDAANVGVIESVEVIDFMCHKRLVVDLCPQINFITGENGSKAHFTNRASNLRGFIREGQSKAEVKVRLRNRGPDAFNSDVYGSSVVIERHISRQGNAGQYKIRNGDTGEVVSTRRDDIVAIIDHMGIQIDNPILILSQDASREFLANTTPDSMYRFFLKGTHLMQLSQDLNTLGEAIERIEASVKRKNEVLPQMRREKDNWKAKLEGVRRAKELWVRLNELEKEIAWAYVVEAEKDVNAARKAAQKEEQKREKTLTKLREEEVAAEQAQERLNEASARYAQREGELEAMERTLEGPNQTVAEIRRELTNLKAIEEDMNREAGIQRQVLDDLERRIEEAKARLAADQDEETRRRREKMANLGDKIKSSQDHIRECEAAQRELSERRGRLVSAANEQDQRRQRVQREISESQKALARLRQQRQNTLAAFGEGVPEVVSEIERTRWKGMKPLGPFGRYVKLRDSRWAQILETLLDKQLNAFLVETHEDRRQLDAIMRRHRCRSNIIISRVDMFDYSHGEPDPAFFTILRVLNIQDEVVTRQLINMARIEQVVLVERRADGDKIILDNDGRYPRNVTSIVSGDGYIVGSRSGGMQSQAIALSRNQGRLVADTQAMIDQENSRLEALRSDLRNIELELQSIQDEVQSCKSKHNEYEHQISNSRRAIAHAKAEIDRCEEELNELTPANISA